VARRQDYAVAFNIDPASAQGAEAPYPVHVDQMIRQVLLTAPGERVDLPEFGCGLRTVLFAGRTAGLEATTQILVQQGLQRWLGSQITLQRVQVAAPDAGDADGEVIVEIDYTLIDDLSKRRATVRVLP
jgi:phage baseplate assembly protein W